MTALAVVPPAEDIVRLPTPKFPGPVDMLVAVNDGHRFLEWYLVECMMRAMAPAFPYMESAKTLSEWGALLAPAVQLRESSPEHGLALATRAVRIEHPGLPKGRHYFLLEGDPAYCITFLDPSAREPDGTFLFRRWSIAMLNVSWLFPPAIVSLVYKTLSYAALTGHVICLGDVEHAFMDFGRDLRALFAARGMKW